MRRVFAIILSLLAFAFLLRVFGQVLVAFFNVNFLPPMSEWYSGLLPYPLLLPIQLLILIVQAKVSMDIWRGSGFFAVHRPRTGSVLRWLSLIYFAAMVLRYVLAMTLHPERRWFGGTIPIFFHIVLAGYLFVLGCFQIWTDRVASTRDGVIEGK
jgi:hypothetical protein